MLFEITLNYFTHRFLASAFDVTLSSMLEVGKGNISTILTAGSISYLVAKPVMGYICDREDPRIIMPTIAVLLSLICFGMTTPFGVKNLTLMWFVYRFIASGGWQATTKLIMKWWHTKEMIKERSRVFGLLSLSSRAGTMVGSLFLGYLLTFPNLRWFHIWWIAGVFGLLSALYVNWNIRKKFQTRKLEPMVKIENKNLVSDSKKPHKMDGIQSTTKAMIIFLQNPNFYLITIAQFAFTGMIEFQPLFPVYLKETLGFSVGEAAMSASLYAAGCAISMFIASIYYIHLNLKQQAVYIGGHILIALIAILHNSFVPVPNPFIAQGLVFLLGVGIAPPFYLPYSMYCIDEGGRHSGSLMGVIDMLSFFSGFLLSANVHWITSTFGWASMWKILALNVFIGGTAMMLYLFRKKQGPLN